MQELPVNMWMILAAGLAKFFFGWFWFNPNVFGKAWMKSFNGNEKKMKKGMGVGMATYLISSLVMAFVLVHAIKYAQAAHGLPDGLAGGLVGGFINWLGFVGATQIYGVVTEKKPFNWFLITSGYELMSMLIMGAILALWA